MSQTGLIGNNYDCYMGIFKLVFLNVLYRGHLITVDNFETNHLNNELYEIQNNRWDWEKRYLHVNYSQNLDLNVTVTMVKIQKFKTCQIR